MASALDILDDLQDISPGKRQKIIEEDVDVGVELPPPPRVGKTFAVTLDREIGMIMTNVVNMMNTKVGKSETKSNGQINISIDDEGLHLFRQDDTQYMDSLIPKRLFQAFEIIGFPPGEVMGFDAKTMRECFKIIHSKTYDRLTLSYGADCLICKSFSDEVETISCSIGQWEFDGAQRFDLESAHYPMTILVDAVELTGCINNMPDTFTWKIDESKSAFSFVGNTGVMEMTMHVPITSEAMSGLRSHRLQKFVSDYSKERFGWLKSQGLKLNIGVSIPVTEKMPIRMKIIFPGPDKSEVRPYVVILTSGKIETS